MHIQSIYQPYVISGWSGHRPAFEWRWNGVELNARERGMKSEA